MIHMLIIENNGWKERKIGNKYKIENASEILSFHLINTGIIDVAVDKIHCENECDGDVDVPL